MSTLFLHQLEAIFGWILAASWQASVLAVLVLLLQKTLGARLNPRWRYALWLLVLVRLLLPALPESAWSLFQFAPPAPASFVEPVTEPLFVADPLPVATPADLPPVEPHYPFSFFSLLAVVWLAGAIFLLLLTWQVNRRFARQIVDSPPITDPELLQLFATAKAELNVTRSIRLIENSQVQSPAIMGLFRPTLLLPADVRGKFDARELRFIFLHELAHLKRGDVISQAIIALLQIVHWFNPVLWFAFRRMRIDREPATDALVLSRTGEDEKESYGLMLIKLLEHFNQRHSLPTLVGILEDKDQFKRRFSLIAKFTRGAYGWSLLGILLIVILALACLTKSKSVEAQQGFARVEVLALKLPESEYQTKRAEIDAAVQQGHNLLLEKVPHARVVIRGYLPVTKFGQESGLQSPPNNPSLMIVCTSTLTQGKIKLTGDVTVNHAKWTTPAQGLRNVDLMPTGHFPLSGTLEPAPAQFQAIPQEGILGPVTAEGPGDKDPYRVFLLFKVWPQQEAPAENTASIETPSPDEKAVIEAVRKGDGPALQKLIDQGVDPALIRDQDQPLLFSARSPEVAEILIAHGADPNVRDRNGETALTRLCREGGDYPAAIVRVLLKHGGDPNATTGEEKMTTLMNAKDGDTVDALIESGADLKAKTKNGDGVLSQTPFNQPSAFDALLRHGVPFDPAKDGPSLLLKAAWINNSAMVKDLLDRGVDPNADGVVGASSAGKSDVMKPIAAAAMGGNVESVALLLDHGAKGDTAMQTAMLNRRPKLVKLLWDRGVRGISELTYAVSQGAPINDLKKLLDKGVPVNSPGAETYSALDLAAQLGNMDAVQLLVARGATVNRGYLSNPKYPIFLLTPLSMAASEGQDEIVAYLLGHGAKFTPAALYQAANNSTPYAGEQRTKDHFEKTVQLLLDAGAMKESIPVEQGCLLSAAIGTRQGPTNLTVLKMLLDAGADPEAPAPFMAENGEKPHSVIGYLREQYQKLKNDPKRVSLADQIKPALDLLEAADKSTTGPTKSRSAEETTVSVDFKDVAPSAALLEVKALAAKKGFAFDLDLSAIDKNAPAITLKTNEASVEDTIGYICRMDHLQYASLEKGNGYRITPLPGAAPQPASGEFITPEGTHVITDNTSLTYTIGEPSVPVQFKYEDGSLKIVRPPPLGSVSFALKDGWKVYTDGTPKLWICNSYGQILWVRLQADQVGFSSWSNEVPALWKQAPPAFLKAIGRNTTNSALLASQLGVVVAPGPDTSNTMVRFATKVIQIGEDDYQAHRSDIDTAVQKGDADALVKLNLKSLHQVGDPFVIVKSGEQGALEAVQYLPYAISFGKDSNGNLTGNDFKRQRLGIRFVTRSTVTDTNVFVKGALAITSLAGWTPTHDITSQPQFQYRNLQISESFQSGQTKGYQLPGEAQMEFRDPTFIFTADKPPSPEENPRSLARDFFFLNVQLYTQDGKAIPAALPTTDNSGNAANVNTTSSTVAAPTETIASTSPSSTTAMSDKPTQLGITVVEIDAKKYSAATDAMDKAVKKGDLHFFDNKEGVTVLPSGQITLPEEKPGSYSLGETQSYIASVVENKDGKPGMTAQTNALFFGLFTSLNRSKESDSFSAAYQLTEAVGFNKTALKADVPGVPNPLLVPAFQVHTFKDAWKMESDKTHGVWLSNEETNGELKLLAQGGQPSIDELIKAKSPSRIAIFITPQTVAANSAQGIPATTSSGPPTNPSGTIAAPDPTLSGTMVRLNARIIQISEADFQAHQSEILATRTEGADALANLNLKSFNQIASYPVVLKTGGQGITAMVKVLNFASAFGKDSDGKQKEADFRRVNLGARFVLKPVVIGNDIDVNAIIDLVSLAGWTTAQDRPPQPDIHRRFLTAKILIQSGHSLGLELPNGAQMEYRDPTLVYTADKIPSPSEYPKTLSRDFLFISADLSAPDGKPVTSTAPNDSSSTGPSMSGTPQVPDSKTSSVSNVTPAPNDIFQQGTHPPTPDSPLLKAIKAKDEKTASQLIADGADVSATDEYGNGALVALFEDWGTPRLPLYLLYSLLAHGKDPNPAYHFPYGDPVPAPVPLLEEVIAIAGDSKLNDADKTTYRQAIETLLDHGATFSQVPDKAQALLLSATRGDLPAVQRAIQQGASVNATNGNGWTALAISLALGYDDASNWLLEHGANTFGAIKPWYDPLDFAVLQGKTEIVEKMIAQGAKPEANDNLLRMAIEQNNQQLFDALMKGGATGKSGISTWSTKNGVRYRYVRTIGLYSCIKNNQTAMAKALLDTGAEAEPQSLQSNRNLAYWAVSFNRPDILKLLLAHGANPLLKDDQGQSARSLAEKSHPDLLPILDAAIKNPPADVTTQPTPAPTPNAPSGNAPDKSSRPVEADPYVYVEATLLQFKIDPADPTQAERFRVVLKTPTHPGIQDLKGFISIGTQPCGRFDLADIAWPQKAGKILSASTNPALHPPSYDDHLAIDLRLRLVAPETLEITGRLEPRDAKGTSLGPVSGTWIQHIGTDGAVLLFLGSQTAAIPQPDGSKLGCLALLKIRYGIKDGVLPLVAADKIKEVNLYPISSEGAEPVYKITDNSRMLEAIQKGDLTALQKLLEKGLDPDAQKSNPVYWAVYYNQPAILKKLLEYHAEANRRSSDSDQAPMELAQSQHPELVQVLQEGAATDRLFKIVRFTDKLKSLHFDLPAFSNAPLDQVIATVTDTEKKIESPNLGLNFVTPISPVIAAARVTLPAQKNVSVYEAIQSIIKAANLTLVFDEDFIRIQPPEHNSAPANTTTTQPTAPYPVNLNNFPTNAPITAINASQNGPTILARQIITPQKELITAQEDADARRVLLKNVKDLPDDQFISTFQALGRGDREITSLQIDIDRDQVKIDSSLKDGLAESHPQIKELRDEMATKKQRIKELVADQRQATVLDSQTADARVARLAQELGASTPPSAAIPDPDTLQKDLLAAREDADARRVLLNNLKDLPDDQFIATLRGLNRTDPVITSLQTDIDNLKQDITNLLKDGFVESHPRIRELRDEVATKQEKIKELVAGLHRAMAIDSQMADSRVVFFTKAAHLPSPPASGSTSAIPTPGASPAQIEVELKVVDIPEDAYEANKEKLDADIAKGDFSIIKDLNNLKGANLLSAPSVTTEPGQKASIDCVRKFTYPTAFDPAKVISNASLSGTNVLLSVPAAPRNFVSKDVGVSMEVTTTLDHEKIILNGKITFTDFDGFTPSNMGIASGGSPSFSTRESLFAEEMDAHRLKGFWIPSPRYEEETVTDKQPNGQITTSQNIIKMRTLVLVTAHQVP